MKMRIAAAASLATVLSGCLLGTDLTGPDAEAARHMANADSLMKASRVSDATREYLIVAEQFPNTRPYPAAVRNAAMLLCLGTNPVRNDTAALRWFDVYLDLPVKSPERELVRTSRSILARLIELQSYASHQDAVVDSASNAARKQAAAAANQELRIRQLEGELQDANAELKELREVDVRLSKSRTKK